MIAGVAHQRRALAVPIDQRAEPIETLQTAMEGFMLSMIDGPSPGSPDILEIGFDRR